jgi:hypothetical protein
MTMPLPESKIKQAILHPEEEVRLTALDYFASSHTGDETIMPLVIQAVEKYGWQRAFRLLRDADELPQTAATVAWLVGELSKEWDLDDVLADNYATAVALVLSQAPVGLLRPNMVELPGFPEELETEFSERLEMGSWDWGTAWAELEDLGMEVYPDGRYSRGDARTARRIIESLARHPERGRSILPLLERRYRGYEKGVMRMLEMPLAELAGRLRLEEAVPMLLGWLQEDDLDLGDSCQKALEWIGGDAVVRAIAAQWPDADDEFRVFFAEVLERIHTDLSCRTSLDLFRAGTSSMVRDPLAHALLGNFVAQAVEPVRQMVRDAEQDDLEGAELRNHLLAACTVMEAAFPEYDRWFQEAREQQWGWGDSQEPDRLREHLAQDDDNFDDEDDFDDEDFDDEDDFDEDDEWDDDESDDEPADEGGVFRENRRDPWGKLDPFQREGPKIGRNDPCPCGSGKKYKWCCMRKDQI